MGKLQAAMWTGFRQILDTIYNFGHGKFSLLGFIFLLRNIKCVLSLIYLAWIFAMILLDPIYNFRERLLQEVQHKVSGLGQCRLNQRGHF